MGFPVPSPFQNSKVDVLDSVASLRGNLFAPDVNKIYVTKNYKYATDTGAMSYRWNATDTTTDDGILHIKNSHYATGRFQPIRPADGMISAQACGPALVDIGTIDRSFDPLGVTRIDYELNRVTGLLRNSGWMGITFGADYAGNKTYSTGGASFVAGSVLPWQPFTLRAVDGASIFCVVPNNGGAINLAAIGEITFNTAAYGPRTWTQTIQGGERIFPGVANIVGLSVGDTVVVRIGADPTDASGVCVSYYFGTIKAITPGSGTTGTVETWESCPEPTPAGVGINLYRTQGQHDMIKVVGFQDYTTVEGFTLDSVQFNCLMYRQCQIDCNWSKVFFCCINTEYGSGLDIPRLHVQTAQGTPTLPGNFIVLASTYATHIGQMIISDISPRTADTLFAVLSEEASCRGTRIDYAEMTWNATGAFAGDCGFAVQTPGQNDIISVGMLVLRGAIQNAYVGNGCTVECLDIKSGPNSYPQLVLDGVQTLLYKGALYRNKITKDHILPIVAGATKTLVMPIRGVTVGVRIKVNSTVGITSVLIAHNDFTGETFEELFEVVANQWCVLGYSGNLKAVNANGYNAFAIRITGDGTVPAGTYAAIEHTCFESDLTYPGALAPDTSNPRVRVSNGAPSLSADFYGQECLDTTNSRWYKAVTVGTGAGDWVPGGAHQAFTDLTGSLAVGQVPNSLVTYAKIQNVSATNTLLGRKSAGAGVVEEILNSGSAAGRTRVEILIDESTITTNTTYTKSWTAALYRSLRWEARAAVGGGIGTITLTGLTGTYDDTIIYSLGASATPSADPHATTWAFGGLDIAGGWNAGEIDCRNGGPRRLTGAYWTISGGVPLRATVVGNNTDTTHDVSGFTMTLSGPGTFTVSLWGVLA